MTRYLVTGGAGFIGSNFIRAVLEAEENAQVTNLDALTYAGVQATIDELDEYPGHRFVRGDVRDRDLVDSLMHGQEAVVHFAAESHVDRSIEGPVLFADTNLVGTAVMLEAARRHAVPRFILVSTDEVYGSIVEGYATEHACLAPSSPYAASKAAADLFALSYATTYGYEVIVTRCTNNYGPYQFPEKLIPLFVTNLMEGHKVPLYGAGTNERDWLHVDDHVAALRLIIDRGSANEIYNIGANAQVSNLELTRRILDVFGRDGSWIEYVPDRPGHDLRYAVDSSKLRALGWEPSSTLEQRLDETIHWYRTHDAWWRPLREGRR